MDYNALFSILPYYPQQWTKEQVLYFLKFISLPELFEKILRQHPNLNGQQMLQLNVDEYFQNYNIPKRDWQTQGLTQYSQYLQDKGIRQLQQNNNNNFNLPSQMTPPNNVLKNNSMMGGEIKNKEQINVLKNNSMMGGEIKNKEQINVLKNNSMMGGEIKNKEQIQQLPEQSVLQMPFYQNQQQMPKSVIQEMQEKFKLRNQQKQETQFQPITPQRQFQQQPANQNQSPLPSPYNYQSQQTSNQLQLPLNQPAQMQSIQFNEPIANNQMQGLDDLIKQIAEPEFSNNKAANQSQSNAINSNAQIMGDFFSQPVKAPISIISQQRQLQTLPSIDNPPKVMIPELEQTQTDVVLIVDMMDDTNQKPTCKFHVDKPVWNIGRLATNNCVLPNDEISRNHCKLIYHRDIKKFAILDLDSSAGTFIRIQDPVLLKINTVFELGSNSFKIADITSAQQEIIISLQITQANESQSYILKFNSNALCYTFGRSPQNNFQISNDNCISSQHSKIYYSNGSLFLEDTKSTNGTWLKLNNQEFLIDKFLRIRIGTSYLLQAYYQNKEIEITELCIICKKNQRNIYYFPCGHCLICQECKSKYAINQCQACNSEIRNYENK